jgi:hypothetical protein
MKSLGLDKGSKTEGDIVPLSQAKSLGDHPLNPQLS